MPSFLTKTFSSFFNRIIQLNQSDNSGVDSTTRNLQTGDGTNTSASLSDDVFAVQPVNDNTTGSMIVKNKGGSNILAVDTTNSVVLVGAAQVNALTLFKEMGLYEFSPATAGYHYPLIANNVGMQGAAATSINVSGLTDAENAIAIYWYLENNITLDAVRYMCTSDGSSETLNFHLFAYDLATTSNHGDLSNGVVHANASETGATAGAIRTGTFTLDTADIDASKVVIGFAEPSSSTDDFSVSFNIKYHIR